MRPTLRILSFLPLLDLEVLLFTMRFKDFGLFLVTVDFDSTLGYPGEGPALHPFLVFPLPPGKWQDPWRRVGEGGKRLRKKTDGNPWDDGVVDKDDPSWEGCVPTIGEDGRAWPPSYSDDAYETDTDDDETGPRSPRTVRR